jgi:hypothetical protein
MAMTSSGDALVVSEAKAQCAYVNYNHTCFPAHQIKVNGQIIYAYSPPSTDPLYVFGCLVQHINKLVGVSPTKTVPAH